MNISYEGIGHIGVTFPADNCVVGHVCKMGAEGKVTGCAAGEAFCGMVETAHGDQAGVQIHGFVEAAYTGSAPAMGYVNLSADGSGGVKADANGRAYLVVKVNTTTMTVTFEL